MKAYQEGAYGLAAYSATVAAIRVLLKKELIPRDEVVRLLLDDAVSRAIAAESNAPGDLASRNAPEVNRQCAELLKILSESL